MNPSTRHQSLLSLADLFSTLCSRNLERQAAVTALLCALLAREHVVLIGKAGTGKTQLVKDLFAGIGGATTFHYLLHRQLSLAELAGPWAVPSMLEGRMERSDAHGGIQHAELVFLDEVFNAPSTSLNALLQLLQERRFERKDAPLWTCIGASNQLPEGLTEGSGTTQNCEALFDRFALVVLVPRLAALENRVKVTFSGRQQPIVPRLSFEEIVGLHQRVRREQDHPPSREVFNAFRRLFGEAEHQENEVSDRRWNTAWRLTCAHAVLRCALEGSRSEGMDWSPNTTPTVEDVAVLEHVLWRGEASRDAVQRAVRLTVDQGWEALEASLLTLTPEVEAMQGRVAKHLIGQGELQSPVLMNDIAALLRRVTNTLNAANDHYTATVLPGPAVQRCIAWLRDAQRGLAEDLRTLQTPARTAQPPKSGAPN